jgi:hypothetical protein
VVVWSCVFLDAEKKSCGFVLSLINFEVKKKERSFGHLLYSNEVPMLHPQTMRQISVRNYVTKNNIIYIYIYIYIYIWWFFFFLFS